MRINEKILSIPPYLSTSWSNVCALKAERGQSGYSLIVTLFDGTKTEVPNLEKQIIDEIFSAYEKSSDASKSIESFSSNLSSLAKPLGLSFKLGLPGMESLKSVLEHNPDDRSIPDLPSDVLDKISQLTLMMGPKEIDNIPEPEPHCNCPHCQITRAMLKGKDSHQPRTLQEDNLLEEIVSDEDLQFKTWDIKQTADNLFVVSNPLDPQEQYNVFLGTPIGCTCGSKDCEHIKAVLSS